MSRLARNSDPETSHAAAHMAEAGLEDTHASLIMDALHLRDSKRGRTSEEIAALCGLDMVQVARRMTKLVRAGRVDVVGTAFLSTGRTGRTYRMRQH